MKIKIELPKASLFFLTTLISTLICFLVVSRFVNDPVVLWVGVPFSFFLSLFFINLVFEDKKKLVLKGITSWIQIFYVIVIVSIILVIFTPSIPYFYGDPTIDGWLKIPVLNWLRYFSAIILTAFSPGYILLRIIDRRKSITGIASFVLSYLFSLLISFVVGFTILELNFNLFDTSKILLVFLNLMLLIIYHLTKRNNYKVSKQKKFLTISNEMVLFVSLLSVILIGYIYIVQVTYPLVAGDPWDMLLRANQYSEQFQIHWGLIMPSEGNYFLFNIYLAVLYSVSGLPCAISYELMYLLGFLPVLAFYASLKSWFADKKSKIPLIATSLSLLLGYMSILTLWEIAIDSDKSLIKMVYNNFLYISIHYLPNVPTALYLVGIPGFFMFLYLLENKMENRTKVFFMIILMVTMYLGHYPETMVSIIFLIVYILFFQREKLPKLGLIPLSALFIVTVIDLATLKYQTIPEIILVRYWNAITINPQYLFTFILAMVAVFSSLFRYKLFINPLIQSFMSNLLERFQYILCKAWRFFRWAFLYFYMLGIIIWFYLPNNITEKYSLINFSPFYTFALRYGPVGLFFILSTFAYLSDIIKKREILFYLTMTVLSLFAEYLQTILGIYIYYPYRYATFSFAGMLVIDAYGLIRFMSLRLTSTKRKMLLIIILFVTILPGAIGTTFFYSMSSNYSKTINSVSMPELKAFEYINQNLKSNVSVLTFTSDSTRKLRAFAKLNEMQVSFLSDWWSFVFEQASEPAIPLCVLSKNNVKYIYLSDYDKININNSNFGSSFLSNLLTYLPIVFYERDGWKESTIYEVPPFSPPSSSSLLAILDDPYSSKLSLDLHKFKFGGIANIEGSEPEDWGSAITNGILDVWITNTRAKYCYVVYDFSDLNISTNEYREFTASVRTDENSYFSVFLYNSTGLIQCPSYRTISREFTTIHSILPEKNIVSLIKIRAELPLQINETTTAHIYLSQIAFNRGTELLNIILPSYAYWDYRILSLSEHSFLSVDYLSNLNISTLVTSELSLNSKNIQPIQKWLSDGGNLIVMGGTYEGAFSKMLSLNFDEKLVASEIRLNSNQIVRIPQTRVEKIQVNDATTIPISYFTLEGKDISALSLYKQFGKGKIIYVQVAPLLSQIDKLSKDYLKLFETVSEIIVYDARIANVTISRYVPNFNDWPALSFIEGNIYVNGDIDLKANFIALPQLKNIQILEPTLFRNMNITSIQSYGNTSVIMTNCSAKFSFRPSDIVDLSYNCTRTGVEVEMTPKEKGILKISFQNSTGYYEVIVTNETVKFIVPPSQHMIALSPTIEVVGKTDFDYSVILVHLDKGYYALGNAVREEVSIDGYCSFKTEHSSEGISLISDFKYDGTVTKKTETKNYEPGVDWNQLLWSSPHLILLSAVTLLAIHIEVLKRRTKKCDRFGGELN